MKIQLGGLVVGLESNNREIQSGWQRLFHPDQLVGMGDPDLMLAATLAPSPSVDQLPPVFAAGEPGNALSIYRPAAARIWLRLPDQIQIEINFDHNRATVYLTESSLSGGRLEDLTAIALAPLLRRHGYYLIHGFTAVLNGRAVLFIGRSGSGKTTSGLSAIGAGWDYFGNDVALVTQHNQMIVALPAFGALNIHPQTLTLLPRFAAWGETFGVDPRDGKVHVPAGRLPRPTARQAPVDLLVFPEIDRDGTSRLQPLAQGVALARLMEDSIDQWDEEFLQDHLHFLSRLAAQAAAGRLILGRDVTPLPWLLANALAGSEPGETPD